jgi:Phosphodiester glycosidase
MRSLLFKSGVFLAMAAAVSGQEAGKVLPGVTWVPVFQGVSRAEFTLAAPRPVRGFVLKMDLQAEGLQFLATPANGEKEGETDAQRTSTFLRTHGMQAAINAAPFAPVVNVEGRGLDVSGLQMSGGAVVSPPQKGGGPALILTKDNKARIGPVPVVPEGAWNVVSGFSVVLRDGGVVPGGTDLHPRTAAGISGDGRTLYWLVVDGRQKGYSGGATTAELGAWLKLLGCADGINLDGGGTSTLVLEGSKGPQIVNRPIHLGLPGNERPSASHLGLRAKPLPAKEGK